MFRTLGVKITVSFVAISTLSLLGLVAFFTVSQERQIIENNESTMTKVTDSVSHGLQAVMLGGYADIAQSYAMSLKNVKQISDFRIMRTDGTEAFLDNKTIDNVNKRKSEVLFEPRDTESARVVLPSDDNALTEAIASESTTKFYATNANGERTLTFVTPILNTKDCYDCHGSDDAIRGAVKLTTSLSDVDERINNTRHTAYKLSVLFVLSIILFTAYVVRRTVVNPINILTKAIHRISSGELHQKVPEIGRDELAFLAKSFNKMTDELELTYLGLKEEHDKITTLIHSTTEGMVVTDKHGRIVLTNPAAEMILRKTTHEIIIGGFLHLVDNPEIIREQINSYKENKNPTQLEYHGRTIELSASTIYGNEDQQIGTAALLRDITEAFELNKELKLMSTSDALTGLYNRRHLDTKLSYEVQRSVRYKSDLTILLLDVDHFKKFNDTHGHDQGDRVLQGLSNTVKNSLRAIDIACRFGGEEFLVILPETNLSGGLIIAERIRKRIETTPIDGLVVTISIGVACTLNGVISSPSELIKLSDQALYYAKDSGRNKVVTLQNNQHEDQNLDEENKQ